MRSVYERYRRLVEETRESAVTIRQLDVEFPEASVYLDQVHAYLEGAEHFLTVASDGRPTFFLNRAHPSLGALAIDWIHWVPQLRRWVGWVEWMAIDSTLRAAWERDVPCDDDGDDGGDCAMGGVPDR